MFRSRKLLFLLVLAMLAFESVAQTTNSYQQTNLVSDVNGVAQHTDPALVNPWGVSFVPGDPFWIANNGTGTSTIYDGSGATALQKVNIPAGPHTNGEAPITGTVANTTTGWMIDGIPSQFLFVSEDGTISGWTGGLTGKIVVDNSAAGAVYKGLATGSTATGNFLYATNFSQNRVDVFDRDFNPVHLTGDFNDPDLPQGYAPFGIQNIGNNRLVVTFALQDASKAGDVAGAGHGFVDVFDTNGTLVTRFASQGTLNSPWGIAVAPADFGPFSNAMLIGNFGDGTINAYDLGTHAFLGQLNNGAARPLVVDGLWALSFGGGGLAGDASSLYFTAGSNGETHGLFGKVTFAANSAGADFQFGADQQSVTVPRGGSGNVMLTITGGPQFNGQVSLACPAAPAGITCDFTPNPIAAGPQDVTVMLAVSVNRGYIAGSRSPGPILGMSMLAGFFMGFPLRRYLRRARAAAMVVGMILTMLLLQTACNYGMSRSTGGTVPLAIVATSGQINHSTTVNVTVQ